MRDRHSPPWFVAIGASGGEGLGDIKELLAQLPRSFEAVILVVLHRPREHLSKLQSVLARVSPMPVVIASEGERFEPGHVYIGEPAHHLTLAGRSFGRLVGDLEHEHRNRTVDLLFNSVAAHGGPRMIGVVLSGALDDGSRGLAAIHKAGGRTMVLTPRDKPWMGMPEHAAAYDGPIDVTGSPSKIAAAILQAVRAEPTEAARPHRPRVST